MRLSNTIWPTPCFAEAPAALVQVGIPVLGVLENMSGLSQQLDKFRFFRPGPNGSQQDVTDQVMQHLPAELQVMPILMCTHCCYCVITISTVTQL